MEPQTRLIVMLTHHDRTVPDAPEVFEACRGTGAEYWGMKEEGLPPERMRALYRRVLDRSTGAQLRKELILDNHSQVMFDPALIPRALLRG